MLEELKDVYGLEWTTSLIDLERDEQKKDWFLRLNPNGMTNSSFEAHDRWIWLIAWRTDSTAVR